MEFPQDLLLAAACFVAGVINAMAGGGSLITVPLLTVYVDLGGQVANGTNRIGVLTQNVSSALSYRKEGFSGVRRAAPILIPVLAGSFVGSFAVARILSERAFEVIFGVMMLPLLLLSFWPPKPSTKNTTASTGSNLRSDVTTNAWPLAVTYLAFFGLGVYGGAFQAGVGLVLLLTLSRSGLDLVSANSVKAVVIAVLTTIAVPVFILSDQVHWGYAAVVSVGFIAGGWIGARFAVRGGERVIRPVMFVAVVALAGRMLGFY